MRELSEGGIGVVTNDKGKVEQRPDLTRVQTLTTNQTVYNVPVQQKGYNYTLDFGQIAIICDNFGLTRRQETTMTLNNDPSGSAARAANAAMAPMAAMLVKPNEVKLVPAIQQDCTTIANNQTPPYSKPAPNLLASTYGELKKVVNEIGQYFSVRGAAEQAYRKARSVKLSADKVRAHNEKTRKYLEDIFGKDMVQKAWGAQLAGPIAWDAKVSSDCELTRNEIQDTWQRCQPAAHDNLKYT